MFILDELIVEILKRLPAKTLLSFMSVSKPWYSLIKNPYFISYHFNHQINQEPKYLLYCDSYSNYYVYTDNENFDKHLEITENYFKYLTGYTCIKVGCCHAIFCYKYHSFHAQDASFVLWNSSIKKSLDLKLLHPIPSDIESSICWFGFDEVSNDYKLVWVGYSTTASEEIIPCGVYIYSLNKRSWRRVNSSFSLKDGRLDFRGVYLNGVIHWVFDRCYSNFYEVQYMPEVILTFCIADETFGVYNLPSEIVYVVPSQDHIRQDGCVDLMTVKRGCKNCLVVVHGDPSNLNFWVMEEEGIEESWIKDFSISRGRQTRILNTRMNGEIVIMKPDSGGLVSLDHRLMRMNPLCSKFLDYVGTYVESLVILL